jgi:GntR family transcriptional regulator, trigonelline degradation regulator
VRVAGSGLDLRIKQDKLVRDKVVDALRQAILDGVLKPGRRLTERELTELTGVSRTSVREALRRLQAEGLVEESPSRGLRVAVPTPEEIEQIYEIRTELEPLAWRLFVERASQQEVDELASIIEELEPGDYATKKLLDRLDRVLLRGCRNPILEEVLGGLYSRSHALRRVSASPAGRMTVAKQEYADLVDATRRRSAADALAAARRHVSAAAESAKAAMGLLVQDPDAASPQGS